MTLPELGNWSWTQTQQVNLPTRSKPGTRARLSIVPLFTSILGVLAFTDPLITSAGLTATGFVANVAVITHEPYRIRASTDLQNWEDQTNFVAVSSNYLFIDPAALTLPMRYYCAVSP
jgi:hypothetical protein